MDHIVDEPGGFAPPMVLVFDRCVRRRRLGEQWVGGVVPRQLGVDRCDRCGEVPCQRERTTVAAQRGARLPEKRWKRTELRVIPGTVIPVHERVPGKERENPRNDPDRRIRELELTAPDQLVGGGTRSERDRRGQGPFRNGGRFDPVGPIGELSQFADPRRQGFGRDVLPVFDLIEVALPDQPNMVGRLAVPVVGVGELGDLGHRSRR